MCCYNSFLGRLIIAKFCRCHDSVAVASVKFCSYHFHFIWISANLYLDQIWNLNRKTFSEVGGMLAVLGVTIVKLAAWPDVAWSNLWWCYVCAWYRPLLFSHYWRCWCPGDKLVCCCPGNNLVAGLLYLPSLEFFMINWACVFLVGFCYSIEALTK